MTLTACGDRDAAISLDNKPSRIVTFSDLPLVIQGLIIERMAEISKNEDFYFSTDSSLSFQYSRSQVDYSKSWFHEVTHNFHYFTINGRKMKLHGNKGDPFILHDSILYYSTELNAIDDYYCTKDYVAIDLTNDLR